MKYVPLIGQATQHNAIAAITERGADVGDTEEVYILVAVDAEESEDTVQQQVELNTVLLKLRHAIVLAAAEVLAAAREVTIEEWYDVA